MTSESACGEVPEWSNGAVSKTVVGASLPRVRIPVSPPCKSNNLLIYMDIKRVVIFTPPNLPSTKKRNSSESQFLEN